jgi:hypothetical protein
MTYNVSSSLKARGQVSAPYAQWVKAQFSAFESLGVLIAGKKTNDSKLNASKHSMKFM